MLLTVDDRTPESIPILSQYKALVYSGNAHYHFNEYKKAEVYLYVLFLQQSKIDITLNVLAYIGFAGLAIFDIAIRRYYIKKLTKFS